MSHRMADLPTHSLAQPQTLRDLSVLSGAAEDRLQHAATEKQLLDAIAQAQRAVDTLQHNGHRVRDAEKVAAGLEGLAQYLRVTQGLTPRPTAGYAP